MADGLADNRSDQDAGLLVHGHELNRRTYLLEQLDDLYGEDGYELPLFDGFDDALIGIGTHHSSMVAVYDVGRCLGILVQQGMTIEEAAEYFDYNVAGAWIGPQTPVFLMMGIPHDGSGSGSGDGFTG